MTSILVTGSLGQLGSEIKTIEKQFPNWQFCFTDVADLDITSLEEFDRFVSRKNFKYLINCAAYTNVDQAEREPDKAHLLNAEAVQNIATVSSRNQIIPIHVSTDYVFSGNAFKPYTENDQTDPQNVYGKSKLKGEMNLQNTCPRSIVVRTSWLYSPFGKNFLKTIAGLCCERTELQVVVDQVGTPTYAHDLANALLKIIQKLEDTPNFKEFGIFHYSNEGVCSWFDFATEIVKSAKATCTVKPTDSKNFKTLASRPYYSVLNKSKIKHSFGLDIRRWQKGIVHCMNRMK